MSVRFPLAFSLFSPILAAGCAGNYVIVPGPGGIFLLIAIIVAIVAGINKLWGRQINRSLAKMANAWMEGRDKR